MSLLLRGLWRLTMSRQEFRRNKRKVKKVVGKDLPKISEDDVVAFTNLADSMAKSKNTNIVIDFLKLTQEALRLEFGFGQTRLDRYTKRLNSIIECIDLDYVTFADFAEEYKVKPRKTVKIDRDLIKRKIKELKNDN